eukprot:248532-Prorocentrum_minimum.AAC.1
MSAWSPRASRSRSPALRRESARRFAAGGGHLRDGELGGGRVSGAGPPQDGHRGCCHGHRRVAADGGHALHPAAQKEDGAQAPVRARFMYPVRGQEGVKRAGALRTSTRSGVRRGSAGVRRGSGGGQEGGRTPDQW